MSANGSSEPHPRNIDDSRNERALVILDELVSILRSPSPHSRAEGIQSPVSAQIVGLANFRHALPLGTAFSRGSTGSSSIVNNEVERAFQPYPGTSRSSQRRNGRFPGARVLPASSRQWIHVFFCLASPETTKSPGNALKQELEADGLGSKVCRIGVMARQDEFIQTIYQLYPLLDGIEFELMKAASGGEGKDLRRIVNEVSIPSLEDVRLLVGRSIVYIRPLVNILPVRGFSSQVLQENQPDDYPVHNEAPHTREEIDTSFNITECIDHVLIIDDLRSQLYADNPGFQPVFVQRDDFAMQVIGTYKSPNFCLFKKPQVIFAGEAGSDVGALQKEFFWRGMTALKNGKWEGRLPFFEGEDNHKLPACDAMLLRSGVFKAIGMFIVHSSIHSGVGFVGLSQAVIEYLTKEDIDGDTPFTITTDDIPSLDARNAIQVLESWMKGLLPSSEQVECVLKIARECDFNENKITVNDCAHLREHLMYHIVIEKRKPQLEALKLAFRSSPLMNFLNGKEYITPGIFPATKDMELQPRMVINKIECIEHPTILESVKEFIETECQDSHVLQELVSAWTGWAVLPDDTLKINVVNDGCFCFHSCFQELEIPQNMSKSDLFLNLRQALQFGSLGFGSV